MLLKLWWNFVTVFPSNEEIPDTAIRVMLDRTPLLDATVSVQSAQFENTWQDSESLWLSVSTATKKTESTPHDADDNGQM